MADWSLNGLETLWEKEKLLIMSNSSFSHSVLKRLVLQKLINTSPFPTTERYLRTDIQINRHTGREKDRLRDRQTQGRETDRQGERLTIRHTESQTYRQTDRQILSLKVSGLTKNIMKNDMTQQLIFVLLVTSIFSFSHTVFNCFLFQRC